MFAFAPFNNNNNNNNSFFAPKVLNASPFVRASPAFPASCYQRQYKSYGASAFQQHGQQAHFFGYQQQQQQQQVPGYLQQPQPQPLPSYRAHVASGFYSNQYHNGQAPCGLYNLPQQQGFVPYGFYGNRAGHYLSHRFVQHPQQASKNKQLQAFHYYDSNACSNASTRRGSFSTCSSQGTSSSAPSSSSSSASSTPRMISSASAPLHVHVSAKAPAIVDRVGPYKIINKFCDVPLPPIIASSQLELSVELPAMHNDHNHADHTDEAILDVTALPPSPFDFCFPSYSGGKDEADESQSCLPSSASSSPPPPPPPPAIITSFAKPALKEAKEPDTFLARYPYGPVCEEFDLQYMDTRCMMVKQYEDAAPPQVGFSDIKMLKTDVLVDGLVNARVKKCSTFVKSYKESNFGAMENEKMVYNRIKKHICTPHILKQVFHVPEDEEAQGVTVMYPFQGRSLLIHVITRSLEIHQVLNVLKYAANWIDFIHYREVAHGHLNLSSLIVQKIPHQDNSTNVVVKVVGMSDCHILNDITDTRPSSSSSSLSLKLKDVKAFGSILKEAWNSCPDKVCICEEEFFTFADACIEKPEKMAGHLYEKLIAIPILTQEIF